MSWTDWLKEDLARSGRFFLAIFILGMTVFVWVLTSFTPSFGMPLDALLVVLFLVFWAGCIASFLASVFCFIAWIYREFD